MFAHMALEKTPLKFTLAFAIFFRPLIRLFHTFHGVFTSPYFPIVMFSFFLLVSTAFSNTGELLEMVNDLKNTITSCVRRICVVMRFILMQEEVEYVTLKDVRQRRDVVFSQAVSRILFTFVLQM